MATHALRRFGPQADTLAHMGGTERNPKKPGPSYEDGELRDPKIEAQQEEGHATRQELLRLIRRGLKIK